MHHFHGNVSMNVKNENVLLLQSAEESEAKRIYEMEKPLSERLRVARTDAFDPLPPQLLRKVRRSKDVADSFDLMYSFRTVCKHGKIC